MKQLKVLMLALTVLMGVGLTSCMKGEDNTIQTPTEIVRVADYFPLVFETSYDLKLYPQNSAPESFDPFTTTFALLQYRFDMAEQPVTSNTKKLNVQLLAVESIDGPSILVSNSEQENMIPDSPIRAFGTGSDQQQFMFFDRNTLIIPISYYAKSDRKKHRFTLEYRKYETKATDTDLVLYLCHNSEEEDEATTDYIYRAYNLNSVLLQFADVTERTPTKITVKAPVSPYGNTLPNTLTSLSVEYNFKSE